MKNYILSICLLAWFPIFSQVQKGIIVEHFTNTKCSNCAQKNPDLYNVLAENPDVIHLAIHPSSPYSSCAFNVHNPSENDQRTYFYDIYGGTPRLVIQGVVQPTSTNFGNSQLFEAYENETSAYSIQLIQEYFDTQNFIKISVVIKKESDSPLTNAYLYSALAEGYVAYDAPNGEGDHYDVFRKSVFAESGMSITLPENIGDTVVQTAVINIHSDWNGNELFSLAMIQSETDKSIIQVASAKGQEILSVKERDNLTAIRLYPNPSTGILHLEGYKGNAPAATVFNLYGQQIHKSTPSGSTINLCHLPAGTYTVQLSTSDYTIQKSIVLLN